MRSRRWSSASSWRSATSFGSTGAIVERGNRLAFGRRAPVLGDRPPRLPAAMPRTRPRPSPASGRTPSSASSRRTSCSRSTRTATDIGGYDPSDAVTYVWLAQAMLMTVYAFGWFEVALRISSGDIATDLAAAARPAPLLARLRPRARALPLRSSAGYRRSCSACSCSTSACRRARRRGSGSRSSVALAVVVSFAYRFLYNLAAFWLLDYRGVGVLAISVALLFSGFIVPLTVLPRLAGGDRAGAPVRGDGADPGRRLPRAGRRARSSPARFCLQAALGGQSCSGSPGSPSARRSRGW